MSPIPFLNAAETCRQNSTAGAITGFVILAAIIGGVVVLAIANARARSQLSTANAELAFLRPENARLQQWLASATGAPVHEAYATGYGTGPTSPPQWHPDPVGRHQFRLWDGAKWTDQVADNGATSTDRLDG